MKHQDWPEYVADLLAQHGGDRQALARAAEAHVSTVGHWLNGTANPTAEKVVSFARNIGRPPVEALVAAGYLAPDEAAEAIVARQSISEISDEILLARRLAE